MIVKQFNDLYKVAEMTIVVDNDFFNCAGWFWINLTEQQHKKMYTLMLKQGAKEGTNSRTNRRYIELANGLQINNITKYEI